MIVIAVERSVSKDFLLTLEDEKSDELQQNENIVSQRNKDEKEVIIDENKSRCQRMWPARVTAMQFTLLNNNNYKNALYKKRP